MTTSTQHRMGALTGIKIVDFSRMLPGPWCTQMLADLGAEVIKIEQPGVGDLGRYNPPRFGRDSTYFHTVNLGKTSVALDLTDPEDLAETHRLMAGADVVVESFRRGVADRLGIGNATAQNLRKDVIYCSVSGFGQSGPFANIPGHDLVVQSLTGVMNVMSVPGDAPPMPAFQAADYAAATYAVTGILAALFRRRETGEGCYLDISMFDSLLSMTNVISGAALARKAGQEPEAIMELWGENPRYDTYRTRDGRGVAVSLLETRIWNEFCRLIGHDNLINEHETPADRHTVHGERARSYREAIAAFCAGYDRDDLAAWARENDVPILPVLDCDEALASEHVKARGMVEWIDHPRDGCIPVLSNPLARSGLTATPRRPAPVLEDPVSAQEGTPHE